MKGDDVVVICEAKVEEENVIRTTASGKTFSMFVVCCRCFSNSQLTAIAKIPEQYEYLKMLKMVLFLNWFERKGVFKNTLLKSKLQCILNNSSII